MKKSPTEKYRRQICEAIFAYRLPEDAITWPIVEVIHTTVLRGTGESTTWHPYVTVRENGKQIYRDAHGYSANARLKELVEELVSVTKLSNGHLYLRPPSPRPVTVNQGTTHENPTPCPA
jgi:hypothetical protein